MNRRNHLFYHSEGTCFMEALPLGNGRIGAMVYGGAVEEKIQVDESTFWSGEHSEKNDIPGMQERLWELRKTLQKKIMKRRTASEKIL